MAQVSRKTQAAMDDALLAILRNPQGSDEAHNAASKLLAEMNTANAELDAKTKTKGE